MCRQIIHELKEGSRHVQAGTRSRRSSDGGQRKGILAADESMGTIKRRFDSIKIESNENNRRAYREMLFTTQGLEEAISGVILFDETIRTAASDGTPFPQVRRASYRASKSIRARSIFRAFPAKSSPKDSMGCARG